MGTIRTFRTPGGYYKLTRLAILLPYRKYGFGRVLVGSLHDWVRQQSKLSGAQTAEIVAHSQIYAIPFYEKCVGCHCVRCIHMCALLTSRSPMLRLGYRAEVRTRCIPAVANADRGTGIRV
jgi:hypothetical protein